MQKNTYAIFGMGNIGRILATRLRAVGIPGGQISICDSDPVRAEATAREFAAQPIVLSASTACAADVILLATPPKAISGILRQLAPKLTQNQVVVSFAAALPLSKLEMLLPGKAVVRVMPNAPSLVGNGMNPVVYGASVTDHARTQVKFVLDALGKSVEVADDLMNWYVGLSGAAMRSLLPALQGLTKAGEEAGLSHPDARHLAAEVMLGTAALVLKTDLTFEQIKALTPMQTVDDDALVLLFLDAARSAQEKTKANEKKLLELA